MLTDHITSMGYALESVSDTTSLAPLLKSCGLTIREESDDDFYHNVKTAPGGVAACVGWTLVDEFAIIHSLAVAPTSRGGGLGVGILATVMASLKADFDVDAIYISAENDGVQRLFRNFGFFPIDSEDLPNSITELSGFVSTGQVLARSYEGIKRGLDKCAFQLIENRTEDATTPLGSVFLFQQTGDVIESNFRGGAVVRAHLLGQIKGDELSFVYHSFTSSNTLSQGKGSIQVLALEDGRRELREQFQTDRVGTNELLLREL